METAEFIMSSSLKSLLVLLSLLLPALFVGLGDRPVYKIQEVRIAETAREMLVGGNWVVPRFNGELRLQKPPLPYWLTAMSYRFFGVDAVATRLPAVIAGLLLALLLWRWIGREAGPEIASASSLLLIASYLGLRYFRSGEADAVLLLCITAACALGYDILNGKGTAARRALFGLALGLGFLSKGPAALAIPLLSLALFAVTEKRAARPLVPLKKLFSVPGVLLLVLVAFGWYAWIFATMPDIAQSFFGKQVDETFISGNHAKPLWWYLGHHFEFFAPWGVLIVPAGWMAYRGSRGQTPAIVRFAWCWLAVVFVLLTATVNKQMQYALLFAPPLVLVLGYYIVVATGAYAKINRSLFGLFCLAALAMVVFAMRQPSASLFLWAAMLFAPLVLKLILRDQDVSLAVLVMAAATATGFLYSEAYLSKEPRKVAAQTIGIAAATRSPLYQLDPPGNGAVSFYAGKAVPPIVAEDIPLRLLDHNEIWLVLEGEAPAVDGVVFESVMKSDEMALYRVRRRE